MWRTGFGLQSFPGRYQIPGVRRAVQINAWNSGRGTRQTAGTRAAHPQRSTSGTQSGLTSRSKVLGPGPLVCPDLSGRSWTGLDSLIRSLGIWEARATCKAQYPGLRREGPCPLEA